MSRHHVAIIINGDAFEAEIEPRMLLSDFIREVARLTGTHVGCEHGVCGACTVQVDGEPVRSCLMLAVQAQGRDVRTVEDLASAGGELHPLQQAFSDTHGLQCGFCTPGFLMLLDAYMRDEPPASASREDVRRAISSNLCRCTGYEGIIDAVDQALAQQAASEDDAR